MPTMAAILKNQNLKKKKVHSLTPHAIFSFSTTYQQFAAHRWTSKKQTQSCVQWDYTQIFTKWGRSANAKCCTWGRKTQCNRTGWGQRFAVWGAPAPNRAWFSSRASQGGRLHCSACRREEGDPIAVLSCLKEGVRTSDSVQTLLAGERANSNRQVAERWVTVRYHENRNMGCAERSKKPLETFKKIRKVTNTCSILVLLW